MARHLKTGCPPERSGADAKKVRDIVTGILDEIQRRGESALREISEKFDKWSPPAFCLSQEEIDRSLSQLSSQNIEDINFAQEQSGGGTDKRLSLWPISAAWQTLV
jgi:sulfopropanediol 3-dehydrogenase